MRCLLCGTQGGRPAFPYETHWNGKAFHYLSCPNCATTCVDPLPDSEDMTAMYSKACYHDKHYGRLDIEAAAAKMARIKSVVGTRRTLLDFGCGNGALMKAASAEGFSCAGVELDPEQRDQASKNSGAPVRTLEETKRTGERFDIIHLGDVLEHLPDPKALLDDLRILLRPQGLFCIEGPLQANPSLVFWTARLIKDIRRLVGSDRPGTTPPTHLIQTNRRAQKAFFTQIMGFQCAQFSVEENGWPYTDLDPGGSSLARLIKHLVGRLAILLSRLDMRRERSLGNRFFAVLEP